MATETCETVKIRSATAPGGYLVINAEDFDPAVHRLFDDGARASQPATANAEEAVGEPVEPSKPDKPRNGKTAKS